MVGEKEWERFKELFPNLAAIAETYMIEPRRAHAIKVRLKNRETYFFDMVEHGRWTLTCDTEVQNQMIFRKK